MLPIFRLTLVIILAGIQVCLLDVYGVLQGAGIDY